MLLELETSLPTCVTVTLVDGLALVRFAFDHSMNYRSVVAFWNSAEDSGCNVEDRVLARHPRTSYSRTMEGNPLGKRERAESNNRARIFARRSFIEMRSGPPLDNETITACQCG